MIPFLNTHELPAILEQARDAGALDAGYIFVRLNGAIGEIFTDWIRNEFPDKADRVLNHISSGHGGKLSDSRTGIRMKGEGVFAETLAAQFGQLKKRLFSDRTMPHYDLSLFRKPEKGQLTLF
jgi:DNA repair photolyase